MIFSFKYVIAVKSSFFSGIADFRPYKIVPIIK